MRVTKSEYRALRAKSEARAARRMERKAENAALAGEAVLKPRKRKRSPSLPKLKKLLWDEISLLVRSWSPVCVMCRVNATYSANHIVPANDGAATRFFLPNIYPGCASCNGSERRQRGSWVYRHKAVFGDEFVDALYAFSETHFPLKKWWVLEQTERMRRLRADLRREV